MPANRALRRGADAEDRPATRRSRVGRACKTAVVVGTVTTALGATLLSSSAHAMSTPYSPLSKQAVSQQASAALSADVAQLVKQQPYVTSKGLWINYDPVWWRAASGPALAAAMSIDDPTMVAVAEKTFDTLIAAHIQPNGSFASHAPDAQSPDIDTMFFATNLGMALRTLGPRLPEATRESWTSALVGAANYLIANGNLAWYTNGNIAIGNALVMALAWKITGSPYWADRYEQAIDFAIHPDQARWKGFGLIVTKYATVPNWADGEGYFAEQGADGKPGFDADYTQVQLNQLARLYIVTGSRRILRLVNFLLNTELAITNTSTWELNTSGGSRHAQADRWIPFISPALELLALRGDRPDLLKYMPSHVASMESMYQAVPTYWNPAAYYDFGLAAATLEMVAGPIG